MRVKVWACFNPIKKTHPLARIRIETLTGTSCTCRGWCRHSLINGEWPPARKYLQTKPSRNHHVLPQKACRPRSGIFRYRSSKSPGTPQRHRSGLSPVSGQKKPRTFVFRFHTHPPVRASTPPQATARPPPPTAVVCFFKL